MTTSSALTGGIATFNPTPSIERSHDVVVSVGRSVPSTADVVGVPVGTKGAVPRQLGLDRTTLAESGFDGKVGQTLVVPRRDGATLVAVGVGDPGDLTPARLRDAAAAFARAAAKHGALATTLAEVAPGVAGRRRRPGRRRGRRCWPATATARLKRDTPARRRRASSRSSPTGARRRRPWRGAERGRVIADAAPAGARPRQHAAAATSPRRGWPRSPASVGAESRLDGRGVRRRRARRARLRRHARRQRRQHRAAAHDQADVPPARGRRATSRSSARASCTTPAASASSRATRCTRR